MSSTKLLNALTKISLPINNIMPRLSLVSQRSMTSKVDQDLSKFLSPRMRFRVIRRDPVPYPSLTAGK